MFKMFLIKYAEIAIKGKNRYLFEDALVEQIRHTLERVEGHFVVTKESGRVYVSCKSDFDFDEVVAALKTVFGIVGICPVVHIEDRGFDNLAEQVVKYMKTQYPEQNKSFKVFTRRVNKRYPMESMEVSAALGEGLDTLLDAVERAAQGAPPDPRHALTSGAVQSCVRTLTRLLADEARRAGLPPVCAATQWLDGTCSLHAPEAARQAVARMERETGLTRGEALPAARYAQVDRLTRFFTLPQTLPGHRRSARIDRVLTGRYTAYPAMAVLLGRKLCSKKPNIRDSLKNMQHFLGKWG